MPAFQTLAPQTLAQTHPAALPARTAAAERALRAERLARLRPAPIPPAAPEPEPVTAPVTAGNAQDEALARLLDALKAARAETPAPRAAAPVATPAAVLHFHRPAVEQAPAPVRDLDRIPGLGPDLIWALGRAGVTRRADLAALEAADLAARLGPIGRLAPVASWIAAARAARS